MTTTHMIDIFIQSQSEISSKPFIFLAPDQKNYFFVLAAGKLERISDLTEALDWWIQSPWLIESPPGPGIELYGNA